MLIGTLTSTDVTIGAIEEKVRLGFEGVDTATDAVSIAVGTETDEEVTAARLDNREPSPGSTAVGKAVEDEDFVVAQVEGMVTAGIVVLMALAAEEKIERMLAKSLAMDERAALPICSMMGRMGASVTPGNITSGRLAVMG